ncbi:MAG TPA: hypothetical protein VH081_10300 [Solirubrobacteraceae bacterium]|jgi:hypothetical protein|nr:hypothetical protein [Solirubrobacteraceae bacterium]
MPRHDSNRRRAAAAAPLAILLLGLLLAACGGSSGSTSSTAGAKTGTNARGQFGARGAALRTCLKKEGITLPERKPGTSGTQRPGGPFGAGGAGAQGGGFQLPKGVTREKLQAALKKCGGGAGLGRGGRRFGGAGNAQRLTKFAACMRSNGIKLPAPNTSGKGAIFDTKGIDTTSSAFKQADAKCAKELRPAGSTGGSGGAPGEGGPGEGAPGGETGAPAGAPGSEAG